MKKRAFTLIELLTVIAIIGILAAILIPVVGKVRDSARGAKCVSHLREIGTACLIYTEENKAYPFYTGSPGNNPWTFYLEPYLNSKRPGSTAYSNSAVVSCPSASLLPANPASGFSRSYSGNPFIIVERVNPNDPVKVSRVTRMSETVLFADSILFNTSSGSARNALTEIDVFKAGIPSVENADQPIDISPDADSVVGGTTVTGGHLRFRHGSKANVVFADCSVRGVIQQQLKQRNFAINY
jgi:prepilin-type N-terminal cleavage/methylation domain-containing protein/prepilin-type processing-associated H-X9-DG protein